MKVIAKILVVVVVSFATWLTTNAILAQQRRGISPPVVSPPPTATIKEGPIKQLSPDAAPVQGVALGTTGAYAEGHLRSFDVSFGDGSATVTAHASLADRRANVSYVWRLRVTDASWKSLAGRVYDDQVFSVAKEGGKLEVPFKEVVDEPQGAAHVELALYSFVAGEDLSFLDDDTKAFQHQAMRWFKNVGK